MLTPQPLGRWIFTSFLALGLAVAAGARAEAQTPPWTGVIADDARSAAQTADGVTLLPPHALSGDGRYLVFHSERTLVTGDTNATSDVFVRDRFTGELSRLSVSSNGDEGNDASSYPSISRNGRHVVFSSCASNLVPDDTNGVCDVFVRDRDLGTTVRVSLGPSGEEATFTYNWTMFAISADGRFVAFGAGFPSSVFQEMYVRDRDGDTDGVFDEAEDSTTTMLNQSLTNGEQLLGVDAPAISADGRWVAYSAGVYDTSSNWLGFRMIVQDRQTSTAFRVDRAVVAEGQYHSTSPDFSDTNELVFHTSVPYLDPEDTDIAYDVYVFNLITGGHTRITQTHETDTYHLWEHEQYPAISADGRYVAFAGYGIQDHRDVYVVDRTTGASYTLNKAADGSIDANGNQPTYGMVSISGDGAHIAFEGSAAILPGGNGLSGLFVATAVSLAPEEIDAPIEFGTVTFDVNVPPGVAWTLNWDYSTGLDTVTPSSGSGPATVEVTVTENNEGQDRSHVITLGTEQVVVHQNIPVIVDWLSPDSGITSGGDYVIIGGSGFQDGVTATFGGVAGVDLEYWGDSMLFVQTPPHAAGAVDVVVTNPGGAPFTLENGFTYVDNTPPVLTPTITGTLGANGWYTSNVLVQWSVVDEDSAITEQYCDDTSVIHDADGFLSGCSATSGGGQAQAEVVIRRDATPPYIDFIGPELMFYVGQAATIDFACTDATSGVATCVGSTVNTSTAGEFPFTITATDHAGNQSSQQHVYAVIERLTPDVNWSVPPAIVAGAALGAAELNATASVPGSFVYSPAAGTVLAAGTHTLSATFTPSDTVTYNTVSRTVTLIVKAVPVISWSPAPITYPSSITSRLNATADVAGSFTYDPPAGTTLGAGTHTLNVTFTPADPSLYTTATSSVSLTVLKGDPALAWAPAGYVTYGTPLGATQLSATAAVPGTFAYVPAAGTVLNGGTHPLSVTFTPADANNYEAATRANSIDVLKQTASISWDWPANIAWSTALGPTQLNATANLPGTFAYDPPAGTVLEPGPRPLTVVFTPDDTVNYTSSSTTVWVTVTKATPVVTWNDPSAIVYGTALGGAQLNATASVPGGYAYFPAAGNTLNAGSHTLHLTFHPADAAHYADVEKTVTLVVDKAAPVVTWNAPAEIVYGTALSPAQLNASANVPGSFAYAPTAGAVPNAGSSSLSVTFTPTDSANYADATASVLLTVAPAASTISWATPTAITYGTALSNAQLNAAGSVAGTVAYAPAAGTVLPAGTHTLSVTLTPSSSNYAPSTTTRSITVTPNVLTVSTNGATKVYGEALPAFAISGTGFVNGDTLASLAGTPSFSTSATATSAPGSYSVTPSGVTSPNYAITFAAGTLTISKANTVTVLTTSPSPSNHNQNVTMTATVSAVAPGSGTPAGSVQFRDNGTLIGTAPLVNGVATFSKNLKRGNHPLTATYVESTNFNGSVGSKTHQVN